MPFVKEPANAKHEFHIRLLVGHDMDELLPSTHWIIGKLPNQRKISILCICVNIKSRLYFSQCHQCLHPTPFCTSKPCILCCGWQMEHNAKKTTHRSIKWAVTLNISAESKLALQPLTLTHTVHKSGLLASFPISNISSSFYTMSVKPLSTHPTIANILPFKISSFTFFRFDLFLQPNPYTASGIKSSTSERSFCSSLEMYKCLCTREASFSLYVYAPSFNPKY